MNTYKAGNWAENAACGGMDTNIFYASEEAKGGRDWKKQLEEEAKMICRVCIVRDVCLQEALDMRDGYGIRGGLTANERRAVVRKQARQVINMAAS